MQTKSISLFGALLLAVAISGCTSAPKSTDAQVDDAQDVVPVAEAYSFPVDPASSEIGWIGTKVTGRHNGTIGVSGGEILVKEGNVVGGNISIDMNTLASTDPNMDDENNGNLTGHLKSPDFFDVANHPTAMFEITGLEVYDESTMGGDLAEMDPEYVLQNPTHMVSGNLEMKGITKNITFPAIVKVQGDGMKATAKFNINRMDWDVKYAGRPDDLISETVHLSFNISSKQLDS